MASNDLANSRGLRVVSQLCGNCRGHSCVATSCFELIDIVSVSSSLRRTFTIASSGPHFFYPCPFLDLIEDITNLKFGSSRPLSIMESVPVMKLDVQSEGVIAQEDPTLGDVKLIAPSSQVDLKNGGAITDEHQVTDNTVATSLVLKPDIEGDATPPDAEEVLEELHPYYKAANTIRSEGIDHDIEETYIDDELSRKNFKLELARAWKVASNLPLNATYHPLLSKLQQRDLCTTIANQADVLFDEKLPDYVVAGEQHYSCITVELAMGKRQADLYHQALARLSPRYFEETVHPDPDLVTSKLPNLAAVTFNSNLANFRARPKYATRLIRPWYIDQYDRGAALFHQVTRATDFEPPYLDRRSMALYMSTHAVKIQYLAGLCSFVVHEEQGKIQINVRNFWELWYIESFLTTIGFEVIALGSYSSSEERQQGLIAFQDVSHPSQVLVTSSHNMISVNHANGAFRYVVYMEPPHSHTPLEHIINKHSENDEPWTHIWFLTCNHTHDQYLQARSALRMSARLVDRLSVTADDLCGEISARKEAGLDVRDLVSTADEIRENKIPDWEELRDRIKADILDSKCRDLYRSLMGQRSDRHGWISMADLEGKDYLPYEAKFGQENPRQHAAALWDADPMRKSSSDGEGISPSRLIFI